MVMSSISPPAKAPSLSYAERAKKAQNIRSPIEVIQSQPSRISQSQSQPISVTPSVSSTSASSAKPPSAVLPSTSSPASVQSPAAQSPPPSARVTSDAKITNGDPITLSSSTKPTPATEAQPSPPKQPPVNFWDRRKEEFAARNASSQKSAAAALQPSISTSRPTVIASTSSSRDSVPQSDDTSLAAETKEQSSSSLAVDDDDDPFVVRQSRAPRPHIPVTPAVFSTDNTEDWPEVGKSIPAPASTVSTETNKPDEHRATNGDSPPTGAARKGGAPKWIPLPLQTPADVQPQPRRDPQPVRGNRTSANSSNNSRPPSNPGQGRNGRNQSGRNSATQSTNVSRVHSNAGSVHSSPRNPRNKRLPGEEVPAGGSIEATNRSSRTGSPLHANPSQTQTQTQAPSFPPSDLTNHPSNYGGYLSPPHGSSPYYPQQTSNLPPVGSPVYRSPSHGAPLGLQPDPSLPMPPPVHGYPYVYPGHYVPYDYISPSAPYPYWNGHHSHPGSGQHSPAYPPSATPSNYTAALPLHVQQHFYPPPMQPQPSTQSNISSAPRSSSTGTTSDRASVRGPDATVPNAAVPPSVDGELQVNGNIRRSTSVVFGSIDVPTTGESTDAVEVDNIEKVFKSLAIGLDPADAAPKTRKSMKFSKGGESLREDTKEIAVDPALAKEAGSTGETKWTFGNEGLSSPPGGAVVDVEATTVQSVEVPVHRPLPVMDEGLGEEFKVRNFGYGFGGPSGNTYGVDVPKSDVDREQKERVEGERDGETDERPETTGLPPAQGPGNGRPRRGGYGGGYGYDRGYGGRRGRGMNGFGRGYGRGYGRGGNHHHHSGNSYSQRQGPPPPFSVTPPPPFQGIPPPMAGPDANSHYYVPPPGAPLATYLPAAYEPYVPPPPPPPHPQSAVGPAPAASSSGHGGHTSPPLPMPMSQLGFPLDATRFYLLGQLEYYLSPQNMAQDFFLRQRMDSKGWIPISLLASFNRVMRLTQDYQLVREVLMLSTLVQVRDHFVRMGGWEQFVLPDAPKSTVEVEEDYSSYVPQHDHPHQDPVRGDDRNASGVPGVSHEGHHDSQQWSHSGTEVDEEVDEDEEEDDVVFVMGKDGGEGMWSHEKRT